MNREILKHFKQTFFSFKKTNEHIIWYINTEVSENILIDINIHNEFSKRFLIEDMKDRLKWNALGPK